MAQSPPWPKEAHDKLLALWEGGFSAAQISEELRQAGYQFSRNAVIGKCHRLAGSGVVESRPKRQLHVAATIREKRSRKIIVLKKTISTKVIMPKRIPTAPDAPILYQAEVSLPIDGGYKPVEYLQLREHHCRSLLDERGSDGLPLSCGRNRVVIDDGRESSYCPEHHRLYTTTAAERTHRRHG